MWREFRVSLRPERRGGFYSPGGGPEHATSSPVPGRGDNDVKASRGPGVRPRARLMDGLIRRRVMSAAFVDTTRPALGARGDLRDSAPVSCASPTCRLLFSKCTGFLCFPALPPLLPVLSCLPPPPPLPLLSKSTPFSRPFQVSPSPKFPGSLGWQGPPCGLLRLGMSTLGLPLESRKGEPLTCLRPAAPGLQHAEPQVRSRSVGFCQ